MDYEPIYYLAWAADRFSIMIRYFDRKTFLDRHNYFYEIDAAEFIPDHADTHLRFVVGSSS